MAILGITNRTENWKTARYFAPLFGHGSVRVARRLLGDEEERAKLQPGDVRLELFWYGVRDDLYQSDNKVDTEREAFTTYSRLFGDLANSVKGFRADGKPFRAPEGSYSVSAKGAMSKLASNLRNTEIDIVLESPSHLFIGEAKHESGLGADGKDFLTHQLIRQYVLAKILLKLPGHKEKEVVPFVVGDSKAYLAKTLQVQFMIAQKWMPKENILDWSDIEALW